MTMAMPTFFFKNGANAMCCDGNTSNQERSTQVEVDVNRLTNMTTMARKRVNLKEQKEAATTGRMPSRIKNKSSKSK